MSDPDTYHRIVLKLSTPFAKEGGQRQDWQLKFSLSGSQTLDQADAEATALDLWSCPKSLCSGQTSLMGWTYYPAGSQIGAASNSYNVGDHVGDRSYYNSPGSQFQNQLEVVALLRAPAGRSSKGRNKYLYKHIHDVGSTVQGVLGGGPATGTSIGVAKWNTGCGPNSLRPCSPSDGTIGTWTINNNLYTRQMRRGVRPK